VEAHALVRRRGFHLSYTTNPPEINATYVTCIRKFLTTATDATDKLCERLKKKVLGYSQWHDIHTEFSENRLTVQRPKRKTSKHKIYVERIGRKLVDWITLAQARDQWQFVIATLLKRLVSAKDEELSDYSSDCRVLMGNFAPCSLQSLTKGRYREPPELGNRNMRSETRGSVVVKALCHKPEGRGIEAR
jgi:hypothetical protein